MRSLAVLGRTRRGLGVKPRGRVRIIGGHFRGRSLSIPNEPGLRPTTDRIRETLFNWLAPVIDDSRCLDCCAGCGALGFEAASRGAREVWMIERADTAVCQLQANVATLRTDRVRVIAADAVRWLREQAAGRFDIVFLDPPFGSGLMTTMVEVLALRGWVGSGSLIYLEAADADGFPPLPAAWTLYRAQRAGKVRFGLVRVEDDDHRP